MKKQLFPITRIASPYFSGSGFLKTIAVALLFFCLITGFLPARSQTFVETYRIGRDLKEYIPLQILGTAGETVLAGTMFNSSPDIHFLHIGSAGNIIDDVFYDDNNRDERVVSMVPLGSRFLITALIRGTFVGDKDRIELLTINANGSFVSERIIESNVASSAYGSLFPVSSIYYNNLLYICGFVTKQLVPPFPPTPDYSTDKQAFVMCYNPSSNMVLACQTYNYNFNPVQALSKDYDIAIRMKPVTTATGAAIFVTGSANSAFVDFAGATTLGSGTMCLIIDPVTLNPFNNNVITNIYSYAEGEYGVGVMEETGGSGFFVVGNQQDLNITSASYLLPMFLNMTYVDASGTVTNAIGAYPRIQFAQFDYAWGLQALNSVTAGAGTKVTIAGLQTNTYNQCIPFNLAPSLSNVNPFLADFTLIASAGSITTGTLNYWKTYLCQTGTGFKTLPNSYVNQGGFLSNMAFNPTFAVRRQGSPAPNDLMLTAPSWNPANNLNLKLIHTNPVGIVQTCAAGFKECNDELFYPNTVFNSPDVPGWTPSNPNANYYTNPPLAGASIKYPITMTRLDCQATGVFRTGNPEEAGNDLIVDGNITISPNPASTFIKLDLGGTVPGETLVKVILTDLTGKVIAELYDRQAAALFLNSRLDLPVLTPGIYFVKVLINHKTATTYKLLIN